MRLSKQLCVPVKYDLKRGYSVGDLVYVRSYRPDHQWTAAVTTKCHSSNIYGVETEHRTWIRNHNHLSPRALSLPNSLVPFPPDIVEGREKTIRILTAT
ncbi:unnamed protein product [Hymenolepis diminuta]|uniref:Uncharacterized protein n=1 Tax=Hymenolepis diminuta TaxID=6216 RepID=A0A564ZC64_HYMDI|nr:unnamed protein product [Hymenolepis diminuta]